jgi:hypothetical protein
MANFFCKWCGSKYSSVSSLTSGSCSKNPEETNTDFTKEAKNRNTSVSIVVASIRAFQVFVQALVLKAHTKNTTLQCDSFSKGGEATLAFF